MNREQVIHQLVMSIIDARNALKNAKIAADILGGEEYAESVTKVLFYLERALDNIPTKVTK
jgi:hypothetical protein